MKIAYIVELDAFCDSGVLKKISSQIKIWNEMGMEGHLFLVSKPPGKKENVISYIKQTYITIYYNKIINLFYKLMNKKQVYINKILTSLDVYKALKLFSPDIIYYRAGIWFPGQIARLGHYPLIVEINSDDIEEAKLYSRFSQKLHLKTRHYLLDRANGYCSVTHELANKMVPKHEPNIVISNGVDLNTIKKTKKTINNSRAQLIFVGNSDCPWHGISKIIYLAENLKHVDFHIVGPELNVYQTTGDNITFYGFLNSKELSLIYSKMDIAIGTLSLHKKNMQEASPLKVREYIAYGLPVILGYIDTDLDGKDYILNIGNHIHNVHNNINEIEQFIRHWKGRSINSELGLLDMRNKEQQRLDFFKQFID